MTTLMNQSAVNKCVGVRIALDVPMPAARAERSRRFGQRVLRVGRRRIHHQDGAEARGRVPTQAAARVLPRARLSTSAPLSLSFSLTLSLSDSLPLSLTHSLSLSPVPCVPWFKWSRVQFTLPFLRGSVKHSPVPPYFPQAGDSSFAALLTYPYICMHFRAASVSVGCALI